MYTECPPELTGEFMDNFRNLYDLAVENSLVGRSELASEEDQQATMDFLVSCSPSSGRR